jgi:hypothetical protein
LGTADSTSVRQLFHEGQCNSTHEAPRPTPSTCCESWVLLLPGHPPVTPSASHGHPVFRVVLLVCFRNLFPVTVSSHCHQVPALWHTFQSSPTWPQVWSTLGLSSTLLMFFDPDVLSRPGASHPSRLSSNPSLVTKLSRVLSGSSHSPMQPTFAWSCIHVSVFLLSKFLEGRN